MILACVNGVFGAAQTTEFGGFIFYPFEKNKSIESNIFAKKANNKKTYVYFIIHNNEIKIGTTKNIKHRISQIQTCCSHEIKLLKFIEGTSVDEKQIHNRFEHLKTRNNGEWFHADESLINFINSL